MIRDGKSGAYRDVVIVLLRNRRSLAQMFRKASERLSEP